MPRLTIAHVHLTLNYSVYSTCARGKAGFTLELCGLDTSYLDSRYEKMNLFYVSAAKLNKKKGDTEFPRDANPFSRATFQLVNCGRRIYGTIHAYTLSLFGNRRNA